MGKGSDLETASFIEAQKAGAPLQEVTVTPLAINPLPETVKCTLPLLP